MQKIIEEIRGSVLSAVLVGVFLVFILALFSGGGEFAEYIKAFLVMIGG